MDKFHIIVASNTDNNKKSLNEGNTSGNNPKKVEKGGTSGGDPKKKK